MTVNRVNSSNNFQLSGSKLRNFMLKLVKSVPKRRSSVNS